MIRLRHTDEWVGLLVIFAVALFVGAALDVGVLRNWFRPTATLRIILPATGVGGLAPGAEVEILGIQMGNVLRVVVQPNQQIYAEAAMDQQAEPFVRRDSKAVIRRRFGIAGDAYIDITRGQGVPMDWRYAVIDATTERAPTETVSALIDEARSKVFPILEDTRATVAALRVTAERIEKGEGTVGHLMANDTLAVDTERTMSSLQGQIAKLGGLLDELNAAARNVNDLSAKAAADKEGLPQVLRRVNAILASLNSVMRDLAQATPHLPQIARHADAASADLPALLTQIQLTVSELEKLVVQLRGNWLIGGSPPPPEPRRLPASNVQP
jgi:phospholipid/cholesterol/gamma-HCH transport system substrate-binding protein